MLFFKTSNKNNFLFIWLICRFKSQLINVNVQLVKIEMSREHAGKH